MLPLLQKESRTPVPMVGANTLRYRIYALQGQRWMRGRWFYHARDLLAVDPDRKADRHAVRRPARLAHACTDLQRLFLAADTDYDSWQLEFPVTVIDR